VVDENGRGVADVVVTSKINGLPADQYRTDDEGRLVADISADGLHRLWFHVSLRDYWTAGAGYYHFDSPSKPKLPEEFTIRLEPGDTLGGIVRDDEGAPIAGARVDLSTWTVQGNLRPVEATSDAEGRWFISIPKGEALSHVRFYHRNYICDSLLAPVSSQTELRAGDAVKVMGRGLVLHGAVRDREGRPIAGALILSQPNNVDMDAADADETTTRSRDDGTFQFNNLPPGKRALAVYATGYAPREVPIDVRKGTSAVEIEIEPGGEMTGQVVGDDGKPVADAQLSIMDWNAGHSFPFTRQAAADADGRFHVAQLPREGTWTVQCSKMTDDGSERVYATTEYAGVRARNEPYRFALCKPTVIEGRVLDAATGEPITRFELTSTWNWSATEESAFRRSSAENVEDAEGRFRWVNSNSVRPPYPETALRIAAPGYLQADTPLFMAGAQSGPIVVRLEHADPIMGAVVDPKGQPVTGAEVAWVGPKRTAFIQYGRFQKEFTYAPERIVPTDAKGRFELPPSKDDGLLVALHASGYAHVKSSEHVSGEQIKLTSWARVEGVVKAGNEGMFEANVCLIAEDPKLTERGGPLQWWFSERTHTDGSFAFDFVPAIPFTAARYVHGLGSHRIHLEPVPGTTTRIAIGGGGAGVRGRVAEPDGLELGEFFDGFELGRHCTEVVAYPVVDADKKPEARSNFLARLKPDGAFRVDDLPPGKYVLDVNVHAPVPPDSCGLPVVVAHARTKFEITKTNGDQPLELESLRLTYVPGPQPGQSVPDLKGKTLAGDDFDLTDLRGKLVLLDFWATWCGPCKEATPRLKELHEKHGLDGRLTFVGVDIDYGSEMARAYVKEQEVPWVQVAAGAWGEDNPLLQAFTVTAVPSFWLIGADGTILARDVPLAELETAIVKSLNDSKY